MEFIPSRPAARERIGRPTPVLAPRRGWSQALRPDSRLDFVKENRYFTHAMSSPVRLLLAASLGLLSVSCMTEPSPTDYTTYSPRDAYDLGYKHGVTDRRRAVSFDPHFNDSIEVPAAHRKDYVWGYTEGYRALDAGVSSK